MSETLLTRGAEGLDRRAFTVDDLDAMFAAGILDREDKIELIRGEIVPMAPQLTPHAYYKSRVGRWFGRVLDIQAYDVGIDVTLKLSADSLFGPDIVIGPPVDITSRSYLGIEQAALIVEVADTSLRRDKDVKALEYGAFGLPELWIIDVNARHTLVWRKTENGFAQVAVTPFDQPLSPLFEPTLSLTITALE